MLTNFDQNDLLTYQGDDFALKLTFTDTDDTPINITGWTVFFTLKKSRHDSDASAAIKLDITSIPNPTTGIVMLELTAAQTDKLSGVYWYDIQIKKLDNTIQTVTNGNIEFQKDTTRRTNPV